MDKIIKAMKEGKKVYLVKDVIKRVPAPKLGTDELCPDCGDICKPYHHPYCDWVRCPFCGHQLLSCGCGISYEVEL